MNIGREEHRHTGRAGVRIAAQIRQDGAGRFTVDILDMSTTGFRMQSLSFINREVRLFLTLPGMAPLMAKVAWVKGDLYGCAFEKPLYAPVFDHITRNFPSLGKGPA